MTSRDLVKKAVHFDGPGRLPQYLSDGKKNDVIWLWHKLPGDIQPWTVKGDTEQRIDSWGIVWERPVGVAEYGEAKKFPIADFSEYKNVKIPECDNEKYYEFKINAVRENNKNENPKYVISVLQFNSLFERSHILVGLDRLMYDFYDHPDELKSFLDIMTEKMCDCVRREAEIGADCILMYDDWGIQDRLLIGIDIIKEFFIPRYKKIWGLAHELGMDTCLHSCGEITGALPCFIDAGLDIIQMDQQENMGLDRLSNDFGGKIAFWCPADVQTVTATGTPEDVRLYVRKMVETLGSHNGGLISKFYPIPDACGHPEENTRAMCDAFREFGV
jgi:hypothetical protein